MNSSQPVYPEIKLSIVEGDFEMRATLMKLIGVPAGFRCVSGHASAEDALKKIPPLNPDVVLMDIRLPRMDGIECVRRLKRRLPATEIIMLTACQKTGDIINAIMAGATGYLLKHTPLGELLDSIRDAYEGGSPMNSVITRKIVHLLQRPLPTGLVKSLSPQQARVFKLWAEGHSYKEIANRLQVTYATVHTHIRYIYKKFQLRSGTQAVTRGLQEPTWKTALAEETEDIDLALPNNYRAFRISPRLPVIAK